MAMRDNEDVRGMMEGNPGEAVVHHSGPWGDQPSNTGAAVKQLCSKTPENADGEINPSAPGETGITPRSDR